MSKLYTLAALAAFAPIVWPVLAAVLVSDDLDLSGPAAGAVIVLGVVAQLSWLALLVEGVVTLL